MKTYRSLNMTNNALRKRYERGDLLVYLQHWNKMTKHYPTDEYMDDVRDGFLKMDNEDVQKAHVYLTEAGIDYIMFKLL